MNNLPVTTTDYNFYIEQFLKDQDVLENTKFTYKKGLKSFFRWVNDSMITDLTPQVVLNYKQWMMIDKSPYTCNLYLQSLKMFFKWTEKKKIFANIAKDVKRAKTPRGFSKDALSQSQAQELLLSMDNARNRAMTLLMVTSGLRSVEITRLDVGDLINVGEITTLKVWGKGRISKDDFITVPVTVVKELQSYISTRKNVKVDDPMFSSESRNNYGNRMCPGTISWIIKTALRNIGIDNPRICCHSLRHSAATFALLSGSSLQETKDLLRHQSLAMTMIYAHNIDRLKSKVSEQIVKYLALTIGNQRLHRV